MSSNDAVTDEEQKLQCEMAFDESVVEESVEISELAVAKCKIGDQEITSGNVDIYIATKSLVFAEKMLDSWVEQHDADRTMRVKYGKWLLWVLAAQVLISGILFLGIGAGYLKYNEFTINLFVSVAYVQVLGLVYVVVRYLFSKEGHISMKDMTDFISGSIHNKKNTTPSA